MNRHAERNHTEQETSLDNKEKRMELTREIVGLGRPVCRLVMGTSFWRSLEQKEGNDLFDAYVEAGGNCFDTALVYYDVEITLGNWMKERGNRSNIIIHAKCAHHETLQPKGSPYEYHLSRVTPKDIEADIEETLRRLRTDYVDILTLHRDDRDQPVGPILECLAEQQRAGRILTFGASNWTLPRLEEAKHYARANRLPSFVVSSPNLSLAFPNEPPWPNCVTACDDTSKEWYRKEGLPVFAWSCLAIGFFGNRYRPLAEIGEVEFAKLMSDRWTSDVVRVFYSDRNFKRLVRAKQLASEKGVSATQIALAWVLNLQLNTFAVAGPRTFQEITELFEAFQITLTADEMEWLNLES